MSGNLHPRAWLIWLAAALAALSLTRNPVYLTLIVLAVAGVGQVLRQQADTPTLPLPLLRLALLILTLSALLNAATAHVGRTVLMRLPAALPLLGGPITLEALVYGALNGLLLVGFLTAFQVLYQAVPVQALIQLLPRAFYPVAVVASIAVSFVPSTLVQFEQIREAQSMRGHQVRGLRDWLPLFLPLLVGGLERALQLAEAMTARGFGSLGAAESDASKVGGDRLRMALAAGLAALLAGLLLVLFWQQRWLGWGVIVLGGGFIMLALVGQGRRVQRTVYRRGVWRRQDSLVAGLAGLVVVAYGLPGSRAALAYTPYPQLALPAVSALLVVTTALLAAPAALLWLSSRTADNFSRGLSKAADN